MKKLFLLSVLTLSALFFAPDTFAIEGACSDHNGVNCNAGMDWDGSVICNDGWKDSTVLYSETKMCEIETSNDEYPSDRYFNFANHQLLKYNSYTNNYLIKVTTDFITESFSDSEINDITKIAMALNSQFFGIISNSLDETKDLLVRQIQERIDSGFNNDPRYTPEEIEAIEDLYSAAISDMRDTQSRFSKVIEVSSEAAKVRNNEQERIFSDISTNHQNYEAIKFLKDENIVSGYSDGTFKPDNSVNRAELLKILIESRVSNFDSETYNLNCFPDIFKGQWFTPYVCYAKERAWIKGYADGRFKPSQSVTKAEAVKIVLNAFGFSIPNTATKTSFMDVFLTDWFAPFIQVAKDNGFLEETTSTYGPNLEMSRAGMSELIYRVLQ